MKIVAALILALLPLLSHSQPRQNFGVTIGSTSYTTDTDAFETSTVSGLSIGLAGNFQYGDRQEVTLELKFNRHELNFVGRADQNSINEDIRLNLKQLELPVTYTFNVIAVNNFKMGLSVGASANGFYEYRLDNESQRNHLLSPNNIEASNLLFDTESENVGLNFFAIGGLRLRIIKHIVLNARYYHGLTNPYRQVPRENPISDYKTDVSYFFYGLTYYF